MRGWIGFEALFGEWVGGLLKTWGLRNIDDTGRLNKLVIADSITPRPGTKERLRRRRTFAGAADGGDFLFDEVFDRVRAAVAFVELLDDGDGVGLVT